MIKKDKVRITKKFKFEAAHALENYDGLCKNIHGHSYQFSITLVGPIINDPRMSSHGMVMDFKQLKFIVNSQIIDQFDHALILRQDSKFTSLDLGDQRIIKVKYQPTCENMIVDFVKRIQSKLPNEVQLVRAYLQETSTSFCEWLLEDNA